MSASAPRTALLVTCLADTFFPRAVEACVRVLRHFGCPVEIPLEQTCCGQPAYNSGFLGEARPVCARLVDIFAPFERVVSPSASCVAMVREHLPELLADDARRAAAARALASKTWELSDFLMHELRVDLAQHVRLDAVITAHWPCHARSQFSADALHHILRGGGDKFRPPARADLCCGFGGAFAVDFADVSERMLSDKLGVIEQTGASDLICSESGCALQIAGGAQRRGRPLRVRHLAEVLAESLGLMAPQP